MGAEYRDPPEQLPIVLQVLLSQVHRLRALDLLGRFLDLGPWAVNLVSLIQKSWLWLLTACQGFLRSHLDIVRETDQRQLFTRQRCLWWSVHWIICNLVFSEQREFSCYRCLFSVIEGYAISQKFYPHIFSIFCLLSIYHVKNIQQLCTGCARRKEFVTLCCQITFIAWIQICLWLFFLSLLLFSYLSVIQQSMTACHLVMPM